ncbi:MAG: hypothetical protein BRC29_03225 [Nanohaloarchaea archaeon SW_7_43_1]|nr:MAG: hypothetical protein BRC29_03225 [Nanohaloarchaea archaeon SW_7_43_1]
MAAFTWKARVDSKGRVTIPARIRKKLGISQGDRISLSLNSTRVIQKQVENREEAIKLLSSLNFVKSFSYSDDFLEVVLDG